MAKHVVSIYPLFQALARAREVFELKRDPDWIPASDYQKAVLQFYKDLHVPAQIPGTDAVITKTKDGVNDLIRTRLYESVERLEQEIGARAYGIATSLKLALTLSAGRTEIESKFRTKYLGAYVSREKVRHYRSPYLAQLIADPLLSTVESEGYIICLYACPTDIVTDDFLLYELTTKAFEVNQQISEFAGLRVPLLQFQCAKELDWLHDLGMRVEEDTVWNAQVALQLVDFRLGLTEEKVEPAAAASLSFTLEEKDVVLDGPFVFSVWREDLERPILVGHVSSKDWLKASQYPAPPG